MASDVTGKVNWNFDAQGSNVMDDEKESLGCANKVYSRIYRFTSVPPLALKQFIKFKFKSLSTLVLNKLNVAGSLVIIGTAQFTDEQDYIAAECLDLTINGKKFRVES